MGTKKEEQIFDRIHNSVLMECSISCDKCKKEQKEYHIDDFTFVEKIISSGWTFKREKVLCDDCAT